MIFDLDESRWWERGNCQGADTELFFPDRGESGAEAKAICASCVVRQECLRWALDHEEFGIWGGMSERGRRIERRKRPVSVRHCQWAPCLRPFTPTNGSQVYCRPEHAAAAASARKVPNRRVG